MKNKKDNCKNHFLSPSISWTMTSSPSTILTVEKCLRLFFLEMSVNSLHSFQFFKHRQRFPPSTHSFLTVMVLPNTNYPNASTFAHCIATFLFLLLYAHPIVTSCNKYNYLYIIEILDFTNT